MNEVCNIWILPLAAATLRVSTPLLFAALGGLISERAGVINIALEGFMLIGAFFGAVTALCTHSPWLGALGAIVAGGLFAAIYALFVIELKGNQIVTGTALNILAMGIPPFVNKILYDVSGSTPSLPINERFHGEPIAIAGLLLVAIVWLFKQTFAGLWITFAGENPRALRASGVSPRAVRWWAVVTSGALAAMGGASLSLYLASSYSRNMTAGRGFMALAALIFGQWKPLPTLLACLFFGLTDALQIRLQGATWNGQAIPVQFIQILPYVVTMIVLAGFVGRSRPPKSLGEPLLET
jgi:simple sugar transport system permease protein